MEVLDSYRQAAPFNVLTSIAWSRAYLADGPLMLAKGYADGGAIGGGANAWPDETGNSGAGFVGVGSPTYQATGLGGQPCVRTASGKYLAGDIGTPSQPDTIVAVFKLTVVQGTRTHCLIGGQEAICTVTADTPDSWGYYAGSEVSSGVAADENPHLVFAFYNGASSSLKLDGAQIATGNPGSGAGGGTSYLGLNRAASNYSPVDVAFLGVKTSALTGTEETQLRAWAQAKYGTP